MKIGIIDYPIRKGNAEQKEIQKLLDMIDALQIYLDTEILDDKEIRKEMKDLLSEYSLEPVFHASVQITVSDLEKLGVAIHDISDAPPYLIFHHNLHEHLKENFVEQIARLNDEEVIPMFENYHRGLELEKIEDYIELFMFIEREGLRSGSVIDIPRFFNDENDVGRSVDTLKKVFSVLIKPQRETILHLIDSKFVDQDNRKWCPIGEGRIPYEMIFHDLKGMNIPYAILEYETLWQIPESFRWMEKY